MAVADFEGICSAHAMVLRAKTGAVLSDFLPFFMQSDLFMERALTRAVLSTEERIQLFAQHVEPTLQRELKHKGAAAGESSYSAELIGYIELVA